MNGVMASFSAEMIKLGRRPAVKLLAGLLVATIFLFGYFTVYQMSEKRTGQDEGAVLELFLRPENVVPVVLNLIKGIGGPIALIIGAVVAGSEYAWGTLKSILSQRPGRGSFLLGQVLGLGALLVVLVLLSFATGLASSLVIARLKGQVVGAPPLGELLRGMGVAWLILATWATLGLALAHAARSAVLAVAAGLIYGLLVEMLIMGLGSEIPFLLLLQKGLPGPNGAALVNSFALLGGPPVQPGSIDPLQALLVLLAYILGATFLPMLLLQRRDVS